MTNESSANAIIGNTLRIIASGEYHPGAELTQKMASYIIELEQKLTDMAVQLANAESKCRELAAESSRVKLVASNLVSEYISNNGTDCEFISCITPSKKTIGTGGVWDMWRLLDLVLRETPATDDFLAEVRAQGVEMFADHILCPDLDGTIREFAAKLRQGAKS